MLVIVLNNANRMKMRLQVFAETGIDVSGPYTV